MSNCKVIALTNQKGCLLYTSKKAEVEKAVITHPVVVGAFAGILRESGYENIVLADSCGHGTTQAVIRLSLIHIFFYMLNLPFGMLTLLIGHTVFCVPYILMEVKARLAGMDPALEEACLLYTSLAAGLIVACFGPYISVV